MGTRETETTFFAEGVLYTKVGGNNNNNSWTPLLLAAAAVAAAGVASYASLMRVFHQGRIKGAAAAAAGEGERS